MISTNIVNDHLCPECGHKIGAHSKSVFGHNPSNKKGMECSKLYNDLLIEKLTAWWNDAIDERDAYMKSYGGACEERDILQKELEQMAICLKDCLMLMEEHGDKIIKSHVSRLSNSYTTLFNYEHKRKKENG